MKKVYTKETTEKKFSNMCASKDLFKIKLRTGSENAEEHEKATAMPCDFIVVTDKETKFIEVKEIFSKPSFVTERFHQQYKMSCLNNKNQCVKCYILLNFVGRGKLFYMGIEEYNNIYRTVGKKSINMKDIPLKFETTWRDIKL